MLTNQRWANIDALIGWTVQADNGPDYVKRAHLKRHPRHCRYIPSSEAQPLSESEENEYDRLNERMHEELRRITKEHFAGTSAPSDVDANHWLSEYFTPFTYQNYDWYGPSYECYVGVRTAYVSADLLRDFQSLLKGDFEDWCIQVYASDTPDFQTDYEVAVFSDQVIVPISAAKAFGVPNPHR